jgi:glycosyltransferase involved in cell wall biosynthesis
MKLLVSVTYYQPYISGLTHTAVILAEDLAKRGHCVRVITIKHLPDLKSHEDISGVEIVRAKPLIQISKGWISREWFGKIISGVKWCDAVLVHLPQPEAVFIALLCKLFRKRLVVLYQCDIHLPPGFFNRIIEFTAYRLNLWTLGWSNKIIVSSQDYAKYSPTLKGFEDKTEGVFLPIKRWKINKSNLEKIKGKIRGEVVVGFIGRMAKDKGIENLLEAIPLIQKQVFPKKLKVVIAGPPDPVGENSYKEMLVDLIRKYKDNVVVLGRLADAEMGGFYKCLDVLVLPSTDSTEAFGLVQVEAMFLGIPVVASDLPGVRVPVKTTGMGIIVKPRDIQGIAGAVVEILSNPKRYKRGVKKAIKVFSNENSFSVFEEMVCGLR